MIEFELKTPIDTTEFNKLCVDIERALGNPSVERKRINGKLVVGYDKETVGVRLVFPGQNFLPVPDQKIEDTISKE
jgi:hypothetical protein